MRKIYIVVEAEVDQEAEKAEVEAFIAEALETWGGQRDPDDPLFKSLDVKRVRVCQNKFKHSYWN